MPEPPHRPFSQSPHQRPFAPTMCSARRLIPRAARRVKVSRSRRERSVPGSTRSALRCASVSGLAGAGAGAGDDQQGGGTADSERPYSIARRCAGLRGRMSAVLALRVNIDSWNVRLASRNAGRKAFSPPQK